MSFLPLLLSSRFEIFQSSDSKEQSCARTLPVMANMKQIAKTAGVSLGSVSHVLNGSVSVSESLRKRVMDAVEAVGYQPSQLARGLRRDKTNMIGMIIPDITNPFFPAVVRGAEDVAFAAGYRLILCNTDNSHEKELVHLNELRTYLPAGLIVIPSSFSDLTAQARSYKEAGASVVCVDRLPRDWEGNSVTVAHEEGACAATSHLIRLGHRQLAVIAGPLHLTNAQQRLAGFRRSLKQANIAIAAEYVQESTFDRQAGYAKSLVLLRLVPRPTAIFASNDLIALGVLQAAHELGLRCPEDLSVIGFDNLELSEYTNPSLTTVHQPGYQLGARAADILLEQVSGRQQSIQHVVLKTDLILRGSVAPPSGKKTVAALQRRRSTAESIPKTRTSRK
jgi:DNA-binding LacI/PurR family transcriptional regulator